jgi:hypothetical protein
MLTCPIIQDPHWLCRGDSEGSSIYYTLKKRLPIGERAHSPHSRQTCGERGIQVAPLPRQPVNGRTLAGNWPDIGL